MEGLYASFMRFKAPETKAEDGALGSEIIYNNLGQKLAKEPRPK